MKFSFYPGCVSRGGCPELYPAAVAVCERLGIELEELEGASCTGAGVLQEHNPFLGDCLNARTFAMAEQLGHPILTICSTCQGVMSQAVKKLDDLEYRQRVNEVLAEEGLEYRGEVKVKHLLWALVEDVGVDRLREEMVAPLDGFKVAPFYGCYIVRPYGRPRLRRASGARTLARNGHRGPRRRGRGLPGKDRCCGFPILTINERNSMAMVANHTLDAKGAGADAMVTPCPLCHLNLDGFQPKAASQANQDIDLPILHLPQLVGMAMGIPSDVLRMGRHIVNTYDVLMKLGLKV